MEQIEIRISRYYRILVFQTKFNWQYQIYDFIIYTSIATWWPIPVFPLDAKKEQICKIMFGGFAVKNQLCIKKSGNFW